ncbi:MAG: hypothetical protein FWG22_06430, partial [Prolixibacteraceae bacterium]|nr:hypothetical protein [Prolixibacteraceae bacterium]
ITGLVILVVLYVIISKIAAYMARKKKRREEHTIYQPSRQTKGQYDSEEEPEYKLIPVTAKEEVNEKAVEKVKKAAEERKIIEKEAVASLTKPEPEKKDEQKTKKKEESVEIEIQEILQEPEKKSPKTVSIPEIEPIILGAVKEKQNEDEENRVDEQEEQLKDELIEAIFGPDVQEVITPEPEVQAEIVEKKPVIEASTPIIEKTKPFVVFPANGYFDVKNKIENIKIETIQLGTQAILDMGKALKNEKIGMQGYMYGEIPYISRHGQKRIIINKFLLLERVYEQTSPAIGCVISEYIFSFKSVLEKYMSTINRFDFFVVYSLENDCLYLCTRSIYDSFTNDETLIPHLSLHEMINSIE